MLSFIIPAYNEGKYISKTIMAIKKHVPEQYVYEVIVVDHGSTDETVSLAKELGANVFVHQGGSVASLRNYGAKKAAGDVFVFIDADILLTSQWKQNIEHVLSALKGGARMLSGSWCCVPENPNWIEKYWFEPLQKINNTHINSGHMILSRKQFDELMGFDESLETGEDYDISMRSKSLGIEVTENHSLKVIHEGYPKGLWEFMLREYWHGKGDASSIKSVFKSKVAMISLVFFMLHVGLLFAIFMRFSLLSIVLCVLGVLLICLCSSYAKYKGESATLIVVNALLYYVYFLSRGVSIITGFFRRGIKKRQRSLLG